MGDGYRALFCKKMKTITVYLTTDDKLSYIDKSIRECWSLKSEGGQGNIRARLFLDKSFEYVSPGEPFDEKDYPNFKKSVTKEEILELLNSYTIERENKLS